MPLVNVMVNGRAYTLGCDEGEEDHLKDLAARVDAKVREAQNMVGAAAGDGKLMLMAALLMADEDHAPAGHAPPPDVVAETGEPADNTAAAEALEAAAARLEALAARLG